jgi:hypothetical protein
MCDSQRQQHVRSAAALEAETPRYGVLRVARAGLNTRDEGVLSGRTAMRQSVPQPTAPLFSRAPILGALVEASAWHPLDPVFRAKRE